MDMHWRGALVPFNEVPAAGCFAFEERGKRCVGVKVVAIQANQEKHYCAVLWTDVEPSEILYRLIDEDYFTTSVLLYPDALFVPSLSPKDLQVAHGIDHHRHVMFSSGRACLVIKNDGIGITLVDFVTGKIITGLGDHHHLALSRWSILRPSFMDARRGSL
jgi:hypothetical protein